MMVTQRPSVGRLGRPNGVPTRSTRRGGWRTGFANKPAHVLLGLIIGAMRRFPTTCPIRTAGTSLNDDDDEKQHQPSHFGIRILECEASGVREHSYEVNADEQTPLRGWAVR